MDEIVHPIDEISASIQLDGGHVVRLTRRSDSEAQPEDERATDPCESTKQALREPLDFPPLAAGTVPGDRVAIAVDEGVPCVAAVVRGVVESFLEAAVDAESISVVATNSATLSACREELEGRGALLPQFVLHDPDDAENLCMVGINKRKEPLQVNRTIFDADVVLPIGNARPDGGSGYSCLYPNFSSAEVIQTYRTPENVASPEGVAKKAKEAEDAGWQIGAMMALQVVPGTNESAAHVIAGEPQAVARRCEALYDERWQFTCPQPVSLVIANLSGGADAQTWQNVGRALSVAAGLLEEGGAVAVCSNLDEQPGESLSRLIGINDLEKAIRKILHDGNEDSVAAWQMAVALERGPVYMLSQLEADTVEEMGVAPVANIEELTRLASHHESCVVIDDAQRAVVTLE